MRFINLILSNFIGQLSTSMVEYIYIHMYPIKFTKMIRILRWHRKRAWIQLFMHVVINNTYKLPSKWYIGFIEVR